MKTLNIMPAAHRKVTDPFRGTALSAETPTEVPASSYWLRRLKFGEVVLVEDKAEPVVLRKRGRQKMNKETEE